MNNSGSRSNESEANERRDRDAGLDGETVHGVVSREKWTIFKKGVHEASSTCLQCHRSVTNALNGLRWMQNELETMLLRNASRLLQRKGSLPTSSIQFKETRADSLLIRENTERYLTWLVTVKEACCSSTALFRWTGGGGARSD